MSFMLGDRAAVWGGGGKGLKKRLHTVGGERLQGGVMEIM